MKFYNGTYGLSYGNWGAIQFPSGTIKGFDSRHYDGVNVSSMTSEELEREIKEDNLHEHGTPGYNSEVFNDFVKSNPEDGSYILVDNQFVIDERAIEE